MALKWMVACLAYCLVFSVSAEPCMTNREDCQRTGFSSISIINNYVFCCAPGFSMNFFNAHCSCTRTSETRDCSQGPKACVGASSISTDGLGNTWCCPAGFGMSTQVSSINGVTTRTCTCTRGLSGASSFKIRGNGNFSASEIQAKFQNWQRKFQTSMRHSMETLTNRMRALNERMRNMRNRMSSTFRNIFRG